MKGYVIGMTSMKLKQELCCSVNQESRIVFQVIYQIFNFTDLNKHK